MAWHFLILAQSYGHILNKEEVSFTAPIKKCHMANSALFLQQFNMLLMQQTSVFPIVILVECFVFTATKG